MQHGFWQGLALVVFLCFGAPLLLLAGGMHILRSCRRKWRAYVLILLSALWIAALLAYCNYIDNRAKRLMYPGGL
ncbi:MAG: hypothetical protein JOY94_11730 [Methylobacteriaceae bacterium]|nr:hypothetical protein [Methylobacteriaceae bacterium]MBV9632988.1 hypothetical protein [Methylobacteriaceae bacterium]